MSVVTVSLLGPRVWQSKPSENVATADEFFTFAMSGRLVIRALVRSRDSRMEVFYTVRSLCDTTVGVSS